MKFLIFIVCMGVFSGSCLSQEELIGIPYNPVLQLLPKSKLTKTKSQSKEALRLPFVDDFSNPLNYYPNPIRWTDSMAFVNQTYPVFPPTIGVVTLDALDAFGELYPQAGVVTFGADTLTSQKIRLDSLFLSNPQKLTPDDSIYLSFYVQPGGGYGEKWNQTGSRPGASDSIILEFYNPQFKAWQYMWGSGGYALDSLLASTSYYFQFVMIPVLDTNFLSADFQFRFRNYCTLSQNETNDRKGNSSQWHLDYIYLNAKRALYRYDSTLRDIAFVTPAKSVLTKYESMPSRQFRASELKSQPELISHFSNTMANLFYEVVPCHYSYLIKSREGDTLYRYDGGSDNIFPFFPDFTYHLSPLQVNPPLNYTFPQMLPLENEFDIVHVIKEGITDDFNPRNDTTTFRQKFWNYYSYDDGTAENGYGIVSQSNSPKLAYQYVLNEPDTLVAFSIYMNTTLDSANRIPFKITVWNSLNGKPNQVLYKDATDRLPDYERFNWVNKYVLDQELLVSDTIYIGIEQQKKGFLNIGFDRNRNASSYLHINADGNWTQGFLTGAVMMRPYFGYKGHVGIPSKVESKSFICKVYPNPAVNRMYIELPENGIHSNDIGLSVYNMLGKLELSCDFKESINIEKLKKGVYLLYIYNKKTSQTYKEKIVVAE